MAEGLWQGHHWGGEGGGPWLRDYGRDIIGAVRGGGHSCVIMTMTLRAYYHTMVGMGRGREGRPCYARYRPADVGRCPPPRLPLQPPHY